ncbi:hypothetical protein [Oceanisphaera pacifica]|uniref:ATPase n=1 Tax=Oceanisphaera pacifica TaxID=2818389 RepID=A0ABS3NJ72_9GAMM|nr:hypothetical protein [Oceanisphaera pacifica]MBO1520641.1 hypothetical protein [Oceanisphaera pacifica]
MSQLTATLNQQQAASTLSGHYVSVITSKSTFTKKYWLDDGELKSKPAANMSAGSVEVKHVSGATEFAELVKSLNHDQALCFGRIEKDAAKVLSKKRFAETGEPLDTVTRSLEYFTFPKAAGVLVLDYDPQEGTEPLTKEQWLAALYKACPALERAGAVYWVSSSSHIYEGETERRGVSGQRLWVMVQDASDITRAGKALYQRLWLAGHGYFEISRAARFLSRTIIDESVWNANGLDFASGADCEAPLRQLRGEPEVIDGVSFDTTVIKDLTGSELEALAEMKEEYKKELQPKVEEAHAEYIKEIVRKIPDSQGRNDAREQIARALNDNVLTGNFEILLADRRAVTIGQMLDNPSEYHLAKTLDPLEPEYDNYKQTGILYLIGGRPNLYSHAHGGQNFKLIRQVSKIELVEGRTYEAVNTTVELFKNMPDVFDMGELLATVNKGRAVALTQRPQMAYFLGEMTQFYRVKTNSKGESYEILLDPSANLIDQIITLRDRRELKKLDAVITAPTMRRDGSILNKVGYDAASRLYLDAKDAGYPIPHEPTQEQVKQAVDTVMYPFKDFPFAAELDRGVMLTAILTAVVRPTLNACPAFGFDAPVQASGKSLLAMCLGLLAGVDAPKVWPHVSSGNEEEIRKRLTTALKDGEPVIIWDNILGTFDSASIAALLTSDTYSDRLLGSSDSVSMPNKALFLMTGNNMTLAGDMPRRVLKCRIDPQTDSPFAREFDLNPREYVKANRLKLVRAALTIIRGYRSDLFAEKAAGNMASFELWDELVRQPVAWVSRDIYPNKFGDPMEVVREAQASDPEQEQLSDLLEAIYAVMADSPFSAKEIITKSSPEFRTMQSLGGAVISEPKQTLYDALADIIGDKHKLTPRSLSKQLGWKKGRVVNGMRLVEAPTVANTKRYSVELVPE